MVGGCLASGPVLQVWRAPPRRKGEVGTPGMDSSLDHAPVNASNGCVCVGGVRESKTWAGGLNSDQGEELRVLRLGTSTEYWGIRAPVRKAEDLFHTKAIIGCDCPWDGRQMELSPKPGSRKGRA